MFKAFVSLTLFFSIPALANYQQLPESEVAPFLAELTSEMYQHVQDLRQNGAGNCIMPNLDVLGIIYKKDGKKLSRDFFFNKLDKLPTSVLLAKEGRFVILVQTVGLRQNYLHIRKDSSNKVTWVTFIMDAHSNNELTFDCQ